MLRTGREFENKLSKQLLKINKSERGFFIKSPTPMKMINYGGKIVPIYSNKALCDFIGIYKGIFILIEAKNISSSRFEFSRLKDHQEKQLSSIRRHGGYSCLIFNFSEKKETYLMDIEDYLVLKSHSNKKSINYNELIQMSHKIIITEIEEFFQNKVG